jgi:hypothetical protein
MPRLVRRQPLRERIMASLNPMDFLLWLSEELETRDWDSATAGTQLGLAMNFVFLLARANSGSSTKSDDVFSDETSSGWIPFFVSTLLLDIASMTLMLIAFFFKGLSPRLDSRCIFVYQRLLYNHTNSQVPTLSSQGRQAAFNTICTSRKSQPVQRITFNTPKLPRESDNT